MHRIFVPLCVCLVLALGVIATEAASEDVADEIISITKAQWAAQMATEKVQVYGDTEILTYNFIGAVKEKDGTVQPLLAKSTRVYIRENNRWMLVHANFAAVN